jgi:mono/diheme cytochrome c family protein
LRTAAALLIGVALAVAAAPSARAESPGNIYLLNCWGCHGAHGEGIGATTPALAGVADFLRARGGRAYLIEVPGVSESALSDGQVAEVMNWIMHTMNRGRLPPDFTPYTAAEVHRYRSTRIDELTKTRRGLIDQLVAMKVRASND